MTPQQIESIRQRILTHLVVQGVSGSVELQYDMTYNCMVALVEIPPRIHQIMIPPGGSLESSAAFVVQELSFYLQGFYTGGSLHDLQKTVRALVEGLILDEGIGRHSEVQVRASRQRVEIRILNQANGRWVDHAIQVPNFGTVTVKELASEIFQEFQEAFLLNGWREHLLGRHASASAGRTPTVPSRVERPCLVGRRVRWRWSRPDELDATRTHEQEEGGTVHRELPAGHVSVRGPGGRMAVVDLDEIELLP